MKKITVVLLTFATACSLLMPITEVSAMENNSNVSSVTNFSVTSFDYQVTALYNTYLYSKKNTSSGGIVISKSGKAKVNSGVWMLAKVSGQSFIEATYGGKKGYIYVSAFK
ncbi:MAG: hypothetical protein ACK5LC_16565 [Coprobacillaceae bacterium]